MDPTLQKNIIFLVRLSIITVGLLAGYLALYYVVPYFVQVLLKVPVFFIPFFLAFILAWLIEPLVRSFQKRFRFSRGTSVLFSLTVLWGSLALFFFFLLSRLVRELMQLYRTFTQTSNTINQTLLALSTNLSNFCHQLSIPPQIIESLRLYMGSVLIKVQFLIQESLDAVFNFFGVLPEVVIIFFIATLATFFFSRDRELIGRLLFNWIAPGWRIKVRGLIREVGGALVGFIRAQAILVSMTAVLSGVGLIILKVNYALSLGLLTGLLDLLPLVGPGLLLVPWSLWSLATGNLSLGCGLLVLYAIIVLVRQMLEPKIVADSLGLHPLAVLIGLYVGLQAGGIVGMFLGPLLLVLLQSLQRAGMIPRIPKNWEIR